MRIKITTLCTLLMSALLVVFPSKTAFAVSDYDNVAHQGSTVITCYQQGPQTGGLFVATGTMDVGATYESLIQSQGNQVFNNYFNAAKNNGQGWVLVNRHYEDEESGEKYSSVDLVVATSPPSSVEFRSPSGSVRHAVLNDSIKAAITCQDPGEPEVSFPPSNLVSDWVIAGRTTSGASEPVFINAPVDYPAGYEGEIISTEMPPAKYVAMGDSYSSGEGNPPFEVGTDTGTNMCHRNSQAWPRLLQNELDLWPTALVACAGAVSDYVINDYNQENVEQPQAVYISEDTELVTITIGGNDVGFGNVLTTCTRATDQQGTAEEKHQIEHDACINAIEDARVVATNQGFRESLEDVYSGIIGLGSEDLQLVVVGYPNLLPAYTDIVGTCKWEGDWITNGANLTSGRDVAEDEVTKSRLLHDELSVAIEQAVSNANNQVQLSQLTEGVTNLDVPQLQGALGDDRIHFVDPSPTFAGHELCRPEPWFNGVIPAVDETQQAQSYHPNSDGQAAYAGVVEMEIDNLP